MAVRTSMAMERATSSWGTSLPTVLPQGLDRFPVSAMSSMTPIA